MRAETKFGKVRKTKKFRDARNGSILGRILIAFYGIILISQGTYASTSTSGPATACSQAFDALESHSRPRPKIETLEDLFQAFTEGLVPDLSDPSHRDAFELYRRMRFGNPNTELNQGTLDQIAEVLRKHPELEKEPFRDYTLERVVREYPVTPELAAFLDSQIASAGQVRSNLFQVEANSGFWRKVLQQTAPRETPKQHREVANREWMKFLDSKLAPELRAKLQNSTLSPVARAKALYQVLIAERKNLAEQGKDLRPISQAIIDLIHTIGYHDPAIIQALKSKNGMERLNAYRKILDERDRFAMELGFAGHFDQVMKEIGIPSGVIVPSSVPLSSGLTEKVEALEKEVMQKSRVLDGSTGTSTGKRTIRHLSLVESPFRSCLGGSDCSSRTYLTRALDPNYHYFTLTDETGASSGHITVALGEAQLHGTQVQVAFIDKIQNVSNTDLPLMIEGIRRSLAEKGYRLALPDDVGDHNGLSNEQITRSFVAKNIARNPDEPLVGFKLHAHRYDFENKYSLADQSLPSHGVLALELSEGLTLNPGRLSRNWKYDDRSGSLDLNRIVQVAIELKNSTKVEDRLRYISSMKALQAAGLKMDPEIETVLLRWISDPSEAFQVRKQALLYELTEKSKSLSGLLSSFTKNDRIQLLQNILDTPRLRGLVFKDKKGMPGLIATVRHNRSLRDLLVSTYVGVKREGVEALIKRVLEATDISDAAAEGLVSEINGSLGVHGITEIERMEGIQKILAMEKQLHGTSIESEFKEEAWVLYALGFPGEESLGRAFISALSSSDPEVRHFGQWLFASRAIEDNQRLSGLSILKAIREIVKLQGVQSPGAKGKAALDFDQAALLWIKSEKVNPELKSSFLLTSFGSTQSSGSSGLHGYKEYQAAIPRSQRPAVVKKIDETTNLRIFERLAAKQGRAGTDRADGTHSALRMLRQYGKLESFEFKAHRFPEGGKRVRLGSPADEAGRGNDEALREATLTRSFEIQATPVTQLQWALVMGKNPSTFYEGGQTLKIRGADIAMNSNRPVENVSWDDAQKFIRKFNDLDPHYKYRLPTEDEWEYAARAGTDTAYSFGDDPSALGAYGWSSENSGNQTHDVASLKPNPSGLYDMHGNVGEWVHDWYDRSRPAHAVDYAGPAAGNIRVIRGGSWGDKPHHTRSAQRSNLRPMVGWFDNLGFRLVREPR